ncbi:hypothetical protein [Bartonella sp. LJL80]
MLKVIHLQEKFYHIMPTLTRLLLAIVVLVALVYGAMVGLVALVKPVTTDMTIDIAPSELHLRDWPYDPPIAAEPAEKQQNGDDSPQAPKPNSAGPAR